MTAPISALQQGAQIEEIPLSIACINRSEKALCEIAAPRAEPFPDKRPECPRRFTPAQFLERSELLIGDRSLDAALYEQIKQFALGAWPTNRAGAGRILKQKRGGNTVTVDAE